MDVGELERAILSDPLDKNLARTVLASRARERGPEAWFDSLSSRERWSPSPRAVKEVVGEEVARVLGRGWQHLGVFSWSCPVRDRDQSPPLREVMSNDLPLLLHVQTGVRFSLVPGGATVFGSGALTVRHRPLLAAVTPCTNH